MLTSLVYEQGLFSSYKLHVYDAESSSNSVCLCAAYSGASKDRYICEGRYLVNVPIHEAGDVVKRWNLRYFMLLGGHQPTLVYYRKASGRSVLLQVIEG